MTDAVNTNVNKRKKDLRKEFQTDLSFGQILCLKLFRTLFVLHFSSISPQPICLPLCV